MITIVLPEKIEYYESKVIKIMKDYDQVSNEYDLMAMEQMIKYRVQDIDKKLSRSLKKVLNVIEKNSINLDSVLVSMSKL